MTTPATVAAAAPREAVKNNTAASAGISAQAATRRARGSRSAHAMCSVQTMPSPASRPVAFQ